MNSDWIQWIFISEFIMNSLNSLWIHWIHYEFMHEFRIYTLNSYPIHYMNSYDAYMNSYVFICLWIHIHMNSYMNSYIYQGSRCRYWAWAKQLPFLWTAIQFGHYRCSSFLYSIRVLQLLFQFESESGAVLRWLHPSGLLALADDWWLGRFACVLRVHFLLRIWHLDWIWWVSYCRSHLASIVVSN